MRDMIFTVSFCGTGCARDEGERKRFWKAQPWQFWMRESRLKSDHDIYDQDTGYLPVRLHHDISPNDPASASDTTASLTVRGVGENDWFNQSSASDPLLISGLLRAPNELVRYARPYSDARNQRSMPAQATGWAAVALALHGANAAARSDALIYNFVGHSRGAVSAIMAAWFLYAYGGEEFAKVPVNIFAIDPVPGPGEWYGILTQLPPNVANYVGVYAWDHLDSGFSPVVPRPNQRMTRRRGERLDGAALVLGRDWKSLADASQLADPLAPGQQEQPKGYSLYACRGRHGTVAGITTSDGGYEPDKRSRDVSAVPRLIYKLARAYLTAWGTTFRARCRVGENAIELRRKIHAAHTDFDAMGLGETRNSRRPLRPYVRRISSIRGTNPLDCYYFEDVAGIPPFKLAYPCTGERHGGGWVKWNFL